MVDMMAC